MPILLELSKLKPGETAVVKELAVIGGKRRRLQDIGLTVNSTVKCLQKSPLGDPSAFLIRGAVIALRSEDSDCVLIESY